MGSKDCCSFTSSLFKLAAVKTAALSTVVDSPMVCTRASASTSMTAIAMRPSMATASSEDSASATSLESPGATNVENYSRSRLSTGAKAEIGVGITVVVVLLAIITFLLMKMRKRKQSEAKVDGIVYQPVEQGKPHMVAYAHAAEPVEMRAESAPIGLGDQHIVELPGSDGGHMKGSK